MANKKEEKELKETKMKKEVKLKSEMYNHDNELIERREEDNTDAILWGLVIGFALFFVLLILIIVLTN